MRRPTCQGLGQNPLLPLRERIAEDVLSRNRQSTSLSPIVGGGVLALSIVVVEKKGVIRRFSRCISEKRSLNDHEDDKNKKHFSGRW